MKILLVTLSLMLILAGCNPEAKRQTELRENMMYAIVYYVGSSNKTDDAKIHADFIRTTLLIYKGQDKSDFEDVAKWMEEDNLEAVTTDYAKLQQDKK
ncbi:hypothetical protein [Paenibacillus sp. SN-8-1]|uniref:hypothetical protein n=1 Tax=Paenibacillus sp. SN-8-1 TaxID=3435409 RepID=UPI003D9A8321